MPEEVIIENAVKESKEEDREWDAEVYIESRKKAKKEDEALSREK